MIVPACFDDSTARSRQFEIIFHEFKRSIGLNHRISMVVGLRASGSEDSGLGPCGLTG